MAAFSKQIIRYDLQSDSTKGAANMLNLFPRVILADKTTELRLSGDELKSGTKVTVSVQSMEKYNVPHTDKYRIDEDNRLIARDIDVNGGGA